MATCALFVDYENVFKSLRGQNIHITHKQLAEIFKAEAVRYGEVVYSRAYAPWDIFPEAMSIFDRNDIKPEYVEGGRKDNADLVMSLAIQEFLRIPGRDAETFILVTGDGDFVHVIRLLQQEQKRVVVWGVEGSISARLVSRVADVVNVQELLARHGVTVAAAPQAAARAGELQPSRDMAVRALILRSESVMLSRSWVQVPFLTLMHEMSVSTLFGEDSEQRRLLIVRCLEAGILETKKQPNPKRPGTDTTFILLKKDNATVGHTLQTVQQLIATVRQLLSELGGANWVEYSLLERALGQELDLSEAERRSFIELCVSEGILRLEKQEGPENGMVAVYLVEDHPLVQQVRPDEDLTPMLRRLILIIDHYLTRTGYLWMSMGLLRQQLSAYGRNEMERAIRVANESGILIIRQQPNQFGARPTTGAYLQADHRVVQQVLQDRDAVLGALAQLFSLRDVVPRVQVHDCLEGALPHHAGHPEEWLQILQSHQLLSETTTADGQPAYLLQKQHPVLVKRVQQLV